MGFCITCRGNGLIGGCPTCKKELLETINKPVELTPERLKTMAIPPHYQGVTWSKDIFLSTHGDAKSQSSMQIYADYLTRIYEIFRSGNIPNKSFFVIAPRCMGKLTWAYSCMQEAMSHNYSVVPIIDNTQYKRLNILSSDKMWSQECKNQSYTIEDYNNSDVLFMTIDPDNFQTSFRTIESVLSKRSRMGKPTFVLSRYTLSQMSLVDQYGTFKTEIQATPLQDKNKYIVIIGG